MPQPPESADLLETIIGVAPGSALSQLRAQRPDIVRHTQGSHDVLLSPSDPGGLSLAERALVAARVAELSGHAGLTRHYRSLLAERGDPPQSQRQDTILRHVERVTTAPGTALPGHIDALRAAGLERAGHRRTDADRRVRQLPGARRGGPGAAGAGKSRMNAKRFTLEAVDWAPWLPPVTLGHRNAGATGGAG